MGIRKKVMIGFICLGVLLLVAGAVSYFELTRIEKHTREILEAGTGNTAILRARLERAYAEYTETVRRYSADSLHDSRLLDNSLYGAELQARRDSLRTAGHDGWLDLTTALGNYLDDAEYDTGTHIDNVENSVYRAITPSLVTVGVVLLLLFVLLFFIDIYYIRPVVKMEKSLEGFLKFNSPFNVTFEGRDEVHKLKEHIGELVDAVRKKSATGL